MCGVIGILFVILLDAGVMMFAVALLSEREQPSLLKSGFAAFSVSILGMLTVGFVGSALPGILGAAAALLFLGCLAAFVIWLCFDMSPVRALGAGGIFLAYKLVTVLPFILVAAT